MERFLNILQSLGKRATTGPEGRDRKRSRTQLPEYTVGGRRTRWATRYKAIHRIQDRWKQVLLRWESSPPHLRPPFPLQEGTSAETPQLITGSWTEPQRYRDKEIQRNRDTEIHSTEVQNSDLRGRQDSALLDGYFSTSN
jgi:hypothetical protein